MTEFDTASAPSPPAGPGRPAPRSSSPRAASRCSARATELNSGDTAPGGCRGATRAVPIKLYDHERRRRGWERTPADARRRARCGSGGREFPPERTLVMAIVNRTPDSFYRPGLTWDEDVALGARARHRGRGRRPPRRRRRARQAGSRGDGGGGDPPGRPVHRAGPGGLPGPGDQRRHLAARAGQGGLRGRRRPAQRHLVGLGPEGRRRGGRVRRRPGLLARRRGAAAHPAAPGGLRRRGGGRARPGAAAGRAGAAGRRGRRTGSSSTRRTTSARTAGTRWRSPGGSAS